MEQPSAQNTFSIGVCFRLAQCNKRIRSICSTPTRSVSRSLAFRPHLNVDPSVRDDPQQDLAQLGVQQVDVIDIQDAPVSTGQQSWQEHSLALRARHVKKKKES